MVLRTDGIVKSYGPTTVLNHVSFVLNPGDRVGIVGANGVGKSTLLKILSGNLAADRGTYTCPSANIGYLPQSPPAAGDASIGDLISEAVRIVRNLESRMRELEVAMATESEERIQPLLNEYEEVSAEFEARGGYQIEHWIEEIFDGLRISALARSRPMVTLSGGERVRVSLATLLLCSPDLLLLDEPTNHLDLEAVEWLETYLVGISGAVMTVSHDRRFLNSTVNAIFEIDEYTHELKRYPGNFDAYIAARAKERVRWESEYQAQTGEIRELRAYVRSSARRVGYGRAARDSDKTAHNYRGERVQSAVARNVRAAEEKLKRLELGRIPKPPAVMEIDSSFDSDALKADFLLRMTHVSKSYEGREVLHDISLDLTRSSRVLLVGANGVGKTTILRIIKGLEQPDRGGVVLAQGCRIGYLPQEPSLPTDAASVLDSYAEGRKGYQEEFIAGILRHGLFHFEDLSKEVRSLSPGQKRKLEIARLIAYRPHVLLLDEPTNYVSLEVLTAFEEAIRQFHGSVVAVSHDRWFVRRFEGNMWELRDDVLWPVRHDDEAPSEAR